MADAGSARRRREEEDDDDVVCLDPSFFVDRSMDTLLPKDAEKHGMHVEAVDGTRTTISNLEGVIFDITLR